MHHEPTRIRLPDWSGRQFRRIVVLPTLVTGIVVVALTLWGQPSIYAWTLFVSLFIVLGARALADGAGERQLLGVGVLAGLPLGLVLAIAELAAGGDGDAVLNLIRLPVIVTLLGVLVTTATGFLRHHRVTLKHFFLGESTPQKRHHP